LFKENNKYLIYPQINKSNIVTSLADSNSLFVATVDSSNSPRKNVTITQFWKNDQSLKIFDQVTVSNITSYFSYLNTCTILSWNLNAAKKEFVVIAEQEVGSSNESVLLIVTYDDSDAYFN